MQNTAYNFASSVFLYLGLHRPLVGKCYKHNFGNLIALTKSRSLFTE